MIAKAVENDRGVRKAVAARGMLASDRAPQNSMPTHMLKMTSCAPCGALAKKKNGSAAQMRPMTAALTVASTTTRSGMAVGAGRPALARRFR